MQTNGEHCKGFWQMCRCKHCLAADRELEQRLEQAAPDERRRIIDENVKELKAARSIQ